MMPIASIGLLVLLATLFLVDVVTLRRRGRRILVIELVIFVAGGLMVAMPEIATRLAAAVGIGRGVDFVIYPAVVWLVRESMLNRHMRWEDSERTADLVRAIAISNAKTRIIEPKVSRT